MPKEFSAFPLTSYEGVGEMRTFPDMSRVITGFFAEKNAALRIKQKSADLRRLVSNAIERTSKKYDQQLKQMKDTEKKEKDRLYGELLTVYAYMITQGDKSATVEDYNTGKEVVIPLDTRLNATDNAQKYFARYNKLKRTYETLKDLTLEVSGEISFLKSVRYELDNAKGNEDLDHIREELVIAGYAKRKDGKGKKREKTPLKSSPIHYVTSDGFDVYVGRNNIQNDEITFKLANTSDWWFHVKGMPGSHVVLRTGGREVPDRAFEEAAAIAAFHSEAKENGKVEVDYLQRKDVKKPNGAKPGYVIYYTNYSMVATPSVPEASVDDV